MSNTQELKSFLSKARKIVILSHRNPDGDAIGSSMALYLVLNKMGHDSQIIMPSDYPEIYSWFPEIDSIKIFDRNQKETTNLTAEADLVFCLDFNSLDRIDKLGDAINPDKQKIVLIDHHIDPKDFAHHIYLDVKAAATAQILYEFFVEIGWTEHVDSDVATCLMTGIITDTGSFKYNASSNLFKVTAEVMSHGVDYGDLQNKLFNSLDEKYLHLLGYCLARRMEILNELKTGIITLSKQDYINFDIKRGDTEGIVNYMLMAKNIEVAVLITAQPNIVKFSFRSKGNISVQKLARLHFNGGGHENASGGYMHSSLFAAQDKLKNVLPDFMNAYLN